MGTNVGLATLGWLSDRAVLRCGRAGVRSARVRKKWTNAFAFHRFAATCIAEGSVPLCSSNMSVLRSSNALSCGAVLTGARPEVFRHCRDCPLMVTLQRKAFASETGLLAVPFSPKENHHDLFHPTPSSSALRQPACAFLDGAAGRFCAELRCITGERCAP